MKNIIKAMPEYLRTLLNKNIKQKYVLVHIFLFFLTSLLIIGVISYNTTRSIQYELIYDVSKRIQSYFKHEVDSLKMITTDWSEWDETFDYINNENDSFIEKNVRDETLKGVHADLVFIVNSNGEIFYSRCLNESLLQEDVDRYIKHNLHVFYTKKDERNISGIVKILGEPYVLSSNNVVKTDGTGVTNAFLILGRRIDSEMIESLFEYTNIKHVDSFSELKIIEDTKNAPDDMIYNYIVNRLNNINKEIAIIETSNAYFAYMHICALDLFNRVTVEIKYNNIIMSVLRTYLLQIFLWQTTLFIIISFFIYIVHYTYNSIKSKGRRK